MPTDVEPHQVMRALAESRLLRRWLSDEVLASFGLSPDGAYVVVFVSEDELDDDLYIIEGARQMASWRGAPVPESLWRTQ